MNNKITSLAINLVIFALAVISVIMIVLAMGSTAEVDSTTGLIKGDAGNVSSAVNFTMIMLYVGLAAIAIFTVIAIITNPKRFIPTAIGIVVFGILIGIGRALVTIETAGPIMGLEGTTPDTLLWGGVGIKTTLVLLVVAIGLIFFQMIRGVVGYLTK
ncbi:hypothetical protein [Crocinitomix catalasitica]|uniref:hypothetical protein n=1 Tax=Crocinitomix catalasitica TaxID=184607 RepID=UPI0012F89A0C|nr:hypothetical protein [Crocinitomix catalasitica]